MKNKLVAAAITLDVCQHAEDSVTLCPCGKPARKKFCSSTCRQAEYRTSAAHIASLKRLRDARTARRADHYQRRNRDRSLNSVRGYSGPVADGVPRRGDLNLKNYLGKTHDYQY
jgi:CDGSH-type Zn-finger protein